MRISKFPKWVQYRYVRIIGIPILIFILFTIWMIVLEPILFGIDEPLLDSVYRSPELLTNLPTMEIISGELYVNVPTSTANAAFIVQDARITYGHIETINCQYVIGGQILDIAGSPINDITVNVESIEIEEIPSVVSHTQPTASAGVSNILGWSVLLPNRDADYQIWLSRKVDSELLSPIVVVPMQNCNNNLAVVNFIQAGQ